MTTSTYHPPVSGNETVDTAEVVKAVRAAIAYRMQLCEAEIAQAMARTSWTTIEEMIGREFTGSYRRYYPKCDMAMRDEAVIAQAFDLLAIAFGDPRRTVRSGAWTRPATLTGGRFDG